jgi:hypothetical protein
MTTRRALRGTLALALVVASLPGGAAPEPPTIAVEVLVRDRRQQPIADLKPAEIELRQDGEAQVVLSMEPGGPPGAYVVRYVPKSGRPGPVMLRVLRPGAVATGPDGGALKVRIEEILTPLERKLSALSDAGPAATGLPHQAFVLRYEREGDELHHTFAVDVPLATVELREEEGLLRGRLGLLARVKDAAGRIVQRFSLEYALETEPAQRDRFRAERLVWTSHLHLPAGDYVLETAVADLVSSAGGAGRLPFAAPAAGPGLRLSSVCVLAAGGALATEETAADNPLRHDDRQLVPALRRQFVAGGEEQLPFYMIVFPDPARADPVQAALELYRQGSLVARGAIALPSGTGAIPYLGNFPVSRLPVGAYEMKVVVRQGAAIAEEAAAFEVVPPPRFKEGSIHRPARPAAAGSTAGRPPTPARAWPAAPGPFPRGA